MRLVSLTDSFAGIEADLLNVYLLITEILQLLF